MPVHLVLEEVEPVHLVLRFWEVESVHNDGDGGTPDFSRICLEINFHYLCMINYAFKKRGTYGCFGQEEGRNHRNQYEC